MPKLKVPYKNKCTIIQKDKIFTHKSNNYMSDL